MFRKSPSSDSPFAGVVCFIENGIFLMYGKRIVIMLYMYVRKSTKKQDTTTQEMQCNQWATNQGFTRVELVQDCGSAYRQPSRRKVGAIIQQAKKKDMILFHSVDRFSRNVAQATRWLKQMEKKNIRWHFLRENLDSRTHDKDKVLDYVRIGEFESRNIGKRNKMARQVRKGTSNNKFMCACCMKTLKDLQDAQGQMNNMTVNEGTSENAAEDSDTDMSDTDSE